MATLNLENHNVEHVTLTVDQARDDDQAWIAAVSDALDNAQAHVFGGDHKVAYLVIEIRA
jgi:hypothetical protein